MDKRVIVSMSVTEEFRLEFHDHTRFEPSPVLRAKLEAHGNRFTSYEEAVQFGTEVLSQAPDGSSFAVLKLYRRTSSGIPMEVQ